jgi:hypothetical protein
MIKLLTEHQRKSSSRLSSRKSSANQQSRSPSRENPIKEKSVHFSTRNRAFIAKSDIEREDGPYAISTSDDNSRDDQAHIVAEMVGLAADAVYFVTEKASFDIDKISYMVYQSHPSSPDWIYDIGTTTHMTDQIDMFESDPRVNETGRRKVKMGDGTLMIRGQGTIFIELTQSKIRLHNILFVLNLGINLVFFVRIVSKGFYIIYDNC